jgi:glycosyltransferase involved in cell wall biosynthesis
LNEEDFDPKEDRDILIFFRGPNSKGIDAKGKKIWFSCDQATVGSYKSLAAEVDKVVTISPFHAEYFKNQYGIENTITIDLPVRHYDYDNVDYVKDPMKILYCSVPERGLEALVPIWERITEAIPEAELHITSDHRLWDRRYPANISANYRLMYAKFPNVTYHSAIKRRELVKLQLESSIHLYPLTYPELFCIANAECQYAGAYPITSNGWALASTNMGYLSPHHPTTRAGQVDLAITTLSYLRNPETLKPLQKYVHDMARRRFSIDNIVGQWDRMVFNG